MRRIATIFSLCLFVTAGSAQTPAAAPSQQAGNPPEAKRAAVLPADQLLQQGRANYQAGRYSEAVQDLRAASAAFLSPEEKQRYIDTGKLDTLPQVEQSLVYLALAYARLGKDPEARDAIMRLANAERIAPTFASLPLDPETSDFPALVARIAPGVTFPENAQLARGGPTTTPPTAIAAAQPAPTPSPVPVTPAAVAAAPCIPAPSQATAQLQPAAAPTAISAADRETMLRQMEEKVAEARAQIDRDAAARIAEAQRQADARVAAEKAAADKAAQEKIAAERAAAEKAATERIAAERAAIERDTAAKIAAEHAAAEKTVQQQTPAQQKTIADRAATGDQTGARVIPAESEQQRTWLTNLRQAQSLAESGNRGDANAIYVAVADAPNAPREIIAAAATGLYRTGDFRHAVSGFSRLGSFARGEEDLRYYYAVSLFEIGRFDEAKRELACSIPFIQATDDVLRYQSKIEQMPSATGR